jgi:hypothetical protein
VTKDDLSVSGDGLSWSNDELMTNHQARHWDPVFYVFRVEHDHVLGSHRRQ